MFYYIYIYIIYDVLLVSYVAYIFGALSEPGLTDKWV